MELTKDAEDDEQKEFVRKMRITNQKEKIIVEKEKKKSEPQSVKTGDPSQMKQWMMIVSAESVVLDSDASDLNSKKEKRVQKKRLSGVEPPHMPPEGIALSTELQTHSDCMINSSTTLFILP